jgi:hypothetical protein
MAHLTLIMGPSDKIVSPPQVVEAVNQSDPIPSGFNSQTSNPIKLFFALSGGVILPSSQKRGKETFLRR